MLPAQPPNSRRISGTRKETFSMWILSGRIWFLNRSWNTMMLSNANEPQIKADISANSRVSLSVGHDNGSLVGPARLRAIDAT